MRRGLKRKPWRTFDQRHFVSLIIIPIPHGCGRNPNYEREKDDMQVNDGEAHGGIGSVVVVGIDSYILKGCSRACEWVRVNGKEATTCFLGKQEKNDMCDEWLGVPGIIDMKRAGLVVVERSEFDQILDRGFLYSVYAASSARVRPPKGCVSSEK